MSAVPSAEIVTSQPQYALVAQTLIDDIRGGRYGVGQLLPPETVLCTQFGVSRHTVREAMRLLIERGLVTRQRGIGTTVTSREPRAHYTQSTASVADLPQYVEETRLVIREVKDVLAIGELSQLLACASGQRWLYARGFRYLGRSKDPIALTHIYVNAAYAGIKGLIGAPNVPVYALIERHYGERVAEVKQRIDAKLMDAQESKALSVPAGSAGLAITRHYYAASGRLLEVALSLHPAERFSYSMSLRTAPA
jgi:DNA-binding GntR family transcriptional regulator